LADALHSDVLIIGAGSSGSVVAEQLLADPSCSVTVVEAGPGAQEIGISALTDNAHILPIGGGSPLVARFDTVLTADPVRTARIVRGATVGGSGAVNGGYFCRAVPADIARWAVPGWSWPEVLEHFRAIESDLDFPDEPVHGAHGPIPVRRTTEITGSTARFVDGAARRGFDWIADLNSGADTDLPTGIGAVPLNIVDGLRRGPGAAFLLPAMARPNLEVRSGVRAQRLRIARGRAVGVEVIGPAGAQVLTADRIVLCAGAIGSAHLLMLSGVGEPHMLESAGIDVLSPAPVGVRCADHPELVLTTDWHNAPSRPALEVVLTVEDLEIRAYTGGFVAMVGDGSAGHPDWPHVGVALMRPRAYGRITVCSPDPAVPPRIEHRYDTAPEDAVALSRGVQVAREICGTTTQLGDPTWSTSQHLCGSVRMGTEDDHDAVVDPRCRVRGIEGLWVIDGSVLPEVPSRGPHATTVMVAHRAAQFVTAS